MIELNQDILNWRTADATTMQLDYAIKKSDLVFLLNMGGTRRTFASPSGLTGRPEVLLPLSRKKTKKRRKEKKTPAFWR